MMKRWLPTRIRKPLGKVRRTYHQFMIDRVHELWYTKNRNKNTYLGHHIRQFAPDLWLYQELVYQGKPDFILQTGILHGGSVLYLAHLLDLMGADPSKIVIGIDMKIKPHAREIDHPRLHLIEGDSVSDATLQKVERILPDNARGLVSLDSDHKFEHVRAEIERYEHLVGVGCHLVVEDTNINGNPVSPQYGPGPLEAVNDFLMTRDDFVRDDIWKKNLFSCHQHGWLKRIR